MFFLESLNKINVTQTFLPNQDEYSLILKESWANKWITNRGSLVLKLEDSIKNRFNITSMIATANGTLPIHIAIKALKISGEVITTPFSYIATTSSLIWEGCKPIFVDIDMTTFNIDPSEIEAKITHKTSAIIATHVFGNPCDIDAINVIAKKYKLKVIYDAAHCFGVNFKQKSIFEYGDVSTCSFHATKVFHTGEGGALFTSNKELYQTLFYHHNFGHKGKESFFGIGINAKMSELQAAMGLAVLPYLDRILLKRKELYLLYSALLRNTISFQKINTDASYNYAFMPIIFENEADLLVVQQKLNQNNIFPRRYFKPSLNTIEYVNGGEMPISEFISVRILCLPMYYELTKTDVLKIVNIIKASIKG
jgi:dTDP-4-amino-4,6-dideoxygalactose transaminase